VGHSEGIVQKLSAALRGCASILRFTLPFPFLTHPTIVIPPASRLRCISTLSSLPSPSEIRSFPHPLVLALWFMCRPTSPATAHTLQPRPLIVREACVCRGTYHDFTHCGTRRSYGVTSGLGWRSQSPFVGMCRAARLSNRLSFCQRLSDTCRRCISFVSCVDLRFTIGLTSLAPIEIGVDCTTGREGINKTKQRSRTPSDR